MFDAEKDARRREQMRKASAGMYARRKAEGRCVRCGGSAGMMPGKTVCAKCRMKASADAKERRKWLKSMGLCTTCGSASAAPGKTRCEMCIIKDIESYERQKAAHAGDGGKWNEHAKEVRRARWARYKAAGICVRCGRGSAWDGTQMCMECTIKNRRAVQAANARKKWERQTPEGRKRTPNIPTHKPGKDHPWKKHCTSSAIPQSPSVTAPERGSGFSRD